MSSTDSIAFALMAVGSITLLFMLSQIAIHEINPDNTQYTWDGVSCQSNFLTNAMSSDCTANGNYSMSNPNNKMPGDDSAVSGGTGNIFTDTYLSAKNWIMDSTGLGFLGDILSAPKNFLVALGLPNAVAFGVAAYWYMVLIFLFMRWMFGR